MKHFFLILLASFFLNSCSIGESENSEFVVLPIDSVEMPTSYSLESASIIKLRYKRPTSCHIFNRILYSADQNTRIVAIEAAKLNQSNCTPDNESVFEIPLYFRPTAPGIYTFKFWAGKDSNNVDQYLIHEIEVL